MPVGGQNPRWRPGCRWVRQDGIGKRLVIGRVLGYFILFVRQHSGRREGDQGAGIQSENDDSGHGTGKDHGCGRG